MGSLWTGVIMKDERTLSRREVLHRGAQLLVVASAPTLLSSCRKEELDCKDTSSLDAADKQLRTSLRYQDRSPHGQTKDCANCQFYRPATKKNQCGACTLIKGPINPAGYCSSWAPKES